MACNRVRTEGAIRIVYQVGIEVAIVAAAVHRFFGIDGNHSAPVLDEVPETGSAIVFALVKSRS
jgi:hypothetical protein